VALAHSPLFRHGQQFKNPFYYFDSVHISEQFTYISASGKAVLSRYLRQGGAKFELYFPFFSKHK
jgi:hypothetical protein